MGWSLTGSCAIKEISSWTNFPLFCLSVETPYITVEWLSFLLCTWEVPGPKLSLEAGYLTDFICSFPQSLQANERIVPQN
jgi:hypothetical protein